MRPAAEAFRRILQIDPRNRHAKNRLSSVLAGKGVGKQSHVARNVIVLVLLAALGGGAYVVVHELKLQERLKTAVKEYEACLAKDDFDGARALMEPFLKEWSVLGTGSEARGYLEQIEQAKSQHEAKRTSSRCPSSSMALSPSPSRTREVTRSSSPRLSRGLRTALCRHPCPGLR